MKNENSTYVYSNTIDSFIKLTVVFCISLYALFSNNVNPFAIEPHLEAMTFYGAFSYILSIVAGVSFAIFGYAIIEDGLGNENDKSCLFYLSFCLFIICVLGIVYFSPETNIEDENDLHNLLYLIGTTSTFLLILIMRFSKLIGSIFIEKATTNNNQ